MSLRISVTIKVKSSQLTWFGCRNLTSSVDESINVLTNRVLFKSEHKEFISLDSTQISRFLALQDVVADRNVLIFLSNPDIGQ